MSFLNLMRNRLKPKEVNDALMDVEGRVLPVTTSATAGQILKLTGENKAPSWADEYSYTPPVYSTTEVNTGYKWIDGRDIYRKVYSRNFGEHETSFSEVFDVIEHIEPVHVGGFLVRADNIWTIVEDYNIGFNASTGNFYGVSIPSTYSEGRYLIIFEYVKTPAPTNETKKKTAKKSN